MKAHHLRRDSLAIVAWGVLTLGSAAAVGAQSAGQAGPAPEASSFDELKRRLQLGANLLVTDSAGREVRGKLSGLSDTSLHLVLHGQPQAFTQADVALVKQRRRDSLWNGQGRQPRAWRGRSNAERLERATANRTIGCDGR
jgi:hypothetical protein